MGKGDEFNCEISFTNPLEEPLTECAVEYESSGVPRCDSLQQPKYVEKKRHVTESNRKYGQEMPQSKITDHSLTPKGRNTDTKANIFY